MSRPSFARAPARLMLAVEILELRGGHRVLDIGSGTGLSIALLLEREPRLRIVSLDRSASATSRVAACVEDAVEDGRVALVTGALCDFDSNERFESVLAVNVNTSGRVTQHRNSRS